MDRELIREQTMQMIFQMDINGSWDYETQSVIPENAAAIDKKQAIRTLEIIRDHIEDIDAIISESTDKWATGRIAKTELAILRNAVAEMKYIDEIPNGVAINEAVNLAKKYGDERSYAFVNSVLRKVNTALEG
ncbi:MAG: transcription antitermination factor NusB [Firmicutes bacterium]|nr:transcription antitermination factor NusB [Bacillota bacterium]